MAGNGPEPCLCGSRKPLAECHRVDPYSDESKAYLQKHASDFHESQARLAANWRRGQPDAEPVAPPPVLVPPAAPAEAA